MTDPGVRYKKTRLHNGIRVVTENHPGSVGVSCGLWVDKGTRDEPTSLVGASHFIEHLVFKGTKRRSAYQIAKSLESVGGDLNAYTTREYTCFHSLSLKDDLRLSVDVLTDLVVNARFTQGEFDREKNVVLQEILMSTDNLEDYVYDVYFEKIFKGHPLARPILGTVKTLQPMGQREIHAYYRGVYRPENMILSCAGDVDHEKVCGLLGKSLRGVHWPKQPRLTLRRKTQPHRIREVISKQAEQVHILIGFPSTPFAETLRFEAFVYNTLLGGGMTSRLYQSVREKKGLVYSIYSQLHTFTDSGLCVIYAACEPRNVKQVLKLTMKEVERLSSQGVRQSDVEMFRAQVRGSVLLGADDVENRMNSLAINEMVFGEYRSVSRVLKEIESVSVASVNRYIQRYVKPKSASVLLMGGIEEKAGRKILADVLD